MRIATSLVLSLAAVSVGHDAAAQVRIQTAPGAFAYTIGDPDRAMIGVSTRTSGKRDTLGLLIESVTRESPAEKAGIEEGDRIVSVNNVNLRLSAADAGEPDMEGVANRRLIRELEKVKAGDEVELRLYRDGATRSVRVKTVRAEELNRPVFAQGMGASDWTRVRNDRAVLGISLGGSGSQRDTLGILVVGVANDGPAAKAGIDEGDRVASINGVDLRVAKEDAGDWQAASTRIRRLNREMEKVNAGDAVELRVYNNGQARTVRVEAVKASEVEGESFFFGNPGELLERIRVAPRAGTRGIIHRPPAVSGTWSLPAVVIPRVDAERRLRAIEEVRGHAELRLRERLKSTADAVRKVRRTITI